MKSGVEYRVALRYIKKIRTPIPRQQKLAEFTPVFHVKSEDGVEVVQGRVEVRSRVFLPEFTAFAEKLGFTHRDGKRSRGAVLMTEDDYAYLRLLVYGVVMSVLRTPDEWGLLEDHVLSMEPIPLRFWASKFRNAYWRHGSRGKLNYLARRFLEVEWF